MESNTATAPATTRTRWYAMDASQVASWLQVDVDFGLPVPEAAVRLEKNGPNALPVEQPLSMLRRLLGQYTSYMQLILVGATVVSLVIAQWGDRDRALHHLALQRGWWAPPAGQGRECNERPTGDDGGDRPRPPWRDRVRDPLGPGGGG